MIDVDDDDTKPENVSDPKASERLDHAWAWFKYHAEQRVITMRFYMLAIGGAGAGVGVLNQARQHALCTMLSCLAALMAFCFLKMDRRASDLVKAGEAALRFEQTRLARKGGSAAFEICRVVDEIRKSWPYTFSDIMKLLLYAVILAFFTVGAINAFASAHLSMLLHLVALS